MSHRFTASDRVSPSGVGVVTVSSARTSPIAKGSKTRSALISVPTSKSEPPSPIPSTVATPEPWGEREPLASSKLDLWCDFARNSRIQLGFVEGFVDSLPETSMNASTKDSMKAGLRQIAEGANQDLALMTTSWRAECERVAKPATNAELAGLYRECQERLTHLEQALKESIAHNQLLQIQLEQKKDEAAAKTEADIVYDIWNGLVDTNNNGMGFSSPNLPPSPEPLPVPEHREMNADEWAEGLDLDAILNEAMDGQVDQFPQLA